ncbi:YmdB family metallophosphoesterase [Oligoflexia bacterium]|nr:YmdB family metallophosphoesterase [Oligoflexia bacterium]
MSDDNKQKRSDIFSILCVGDVVARRGREFLKEQCAFLRNQHQVDLFIANAENASGGTGLEPSSAKELQSAGVDVMTLGDHAWKWREVRGFLDNNSELCIRPANFPPGAPGQGWTVWTSAGGVKVGIMNLLGRTFINANLDCPFRKADELLAGPLSDCDIVVCDCHAEATSEKFALAHYLDGKISLLFGTHTHVATADSQVLPKGTGYITDLGMCGCTEGVLGMDSTVAIERFVTGLPRGYKAAKGACKLNGIIASIERSTGKALKVERVEVQSSD